MHFPLKMGVFHCYVSLPDGSFMIVNFYLGLGGKTLGVDVGPAKYVKLELSDEFPDWVRPVKLIDECFRAHLTAGRTKETEDL